MKRWEKIAKWVSMEEVKRNARERELLLSPLHMTNWQPTDRSNHILMSKFFSILVFWFRPPQNMFHQHHHQCGSHKAATNSIGDKANEQVWIRADSEKRKNRIEMKWSWSSLRIWKIVVLYIHTMSGEDGGGAGSGRGDYYIYYFCICSLLECVSVRPRQYNLHTLESVEPIYI